MQSGTKHYILLFLIGLASGSGPVSGAIKANANRDKDAALVLIKYTKNWDLYDNSLGIDRHYTSQIYWTLNQPGSYFWDSCSIFYDDVPISNYGWLDLRWNERGDGWSYGFSIPTKGNCGDRDYSNPNPLTGYRPSTPSRICQGGSFRIVTDQYGDDDDQSVNRQEKAVYELRTGAKGYPGRQNLFYLSAAATAYSDFFYPEFDGYTGSYTINPTAVQIGDLGRLSSDGLLFAALPNNETRDATPQVKSSRYFAFGLTCGKCQFLSQCNSPIPTNQDRTTLGVAEDVHIYFNPAPPVNPVWTTTAGTLTGSGYMVTFTAPDHQSGATVTANVRGTKLSIDFSVIEPTGIDHADLVEYWPYSSTTLAGAGMHLRPFIGPMNVSFYKVQIVEVGEDASDIQGYFKSHPPPSHKGPGPGKGDVWLQIQNDNSWDPAWDYATSSGWPSIWSPGSYTWDIPAKWRVGNGSEHSMAGWNQVHTISANGTMTVSKFGHTVSRTIQNVYTGQ